MKIKNPARHMPHYAIRIYYPDGTQMNKRGSAQPEISVPVEEGDYVALVLEGLTDARVAQIKLLLVDGAWTDFSDELLAEMLAPKPKPKRKRKPKPEPEKEVCGPDIALPKPEPAEWAESEPEKEPVMLKRSKPTSGLTPKKYRKSDRAPAAE